MARVREPERTHIVCSMPKMYSHQCSLLLLPLANWPVLPVEYRSTLMQALSPCAEYVNYHPTPASNRTYRECAMHGAIIFPQSAILPCKPPGFICGAARNIAGPSGPFRIKFTTQSWSTYFRAYPTKSNPRPRAPFTSTWPACCHAP